MGSRNFSKKVLPDHVVREYESHIEKLLSIPVQEEEGDIKPYILHFSSEAYEEWREFAEDIEPGLKDGGRYESMKDWVGKLPGAVVRIAGLIHCMGYPDRPWEQEIHLDTMGKALELASVLLNHAMHTFDIMGSDSRLVAAKRILKWIELKQKEGFSRRDCLEGVKGTLKTMKEVQPRLDILEERFYIFMDDLEQKVGRPTRHYTVNPALITDW